TNSTYLLSSKPSATTTQR
ncbi:transketolase, partial [Vibrio parahaemolyticus VPTS-2010]